MSESILPTFHQAFFEYIVLYEQPALKTWNIGALAQALFGAFQQWGVKLEDISAHTTGNNASEVMTRVELLNRRASLEVGMGQLRFSVFDPSWDLAETYVPVLETAIGTATAALEVKPAKQTLTIAFHFTDPRRSPGEATAAFLNPKSELLGDPLVRSFGVSQYREDGFFVLDTSIAHENALFMRIARVFEGNVGTREALTRLYEDQVRYLALLGLKVG